MLTDGATFTCSTACHEAAGQYRTSCHYNNDDMEGLRRVLKPLMLQCGQEAVVKITMSGNVEDYNEEKVTKLKSDIATEANVQVGAVSVSISQGSVIVTAQVPYDSAKPLENKVKAKELTTLAGADVTDAKVADYREFVHPTTTTTGASDSGLSTGATVGIVFGVIALLALIAAVTFMMVNGKRKRREMELATVTTEY